MWSLFFKVVALVYEDRNFCISKCRNWGWPYTRVSAVVMLSGSLPWIFWNFISSSPESSVLITVGKRGLFWLTSPLMSNSAYWQANEFWLRHEGQQGFVEYLSRSLEVLDWGWTIPGISSVFQLTLLCRSMTKDFENWRVCGRNDNRKTICDIRIA